MRRALILYLAIALMGCGVANPSNPCPPTPLASAPAPQLTGSPLSVLPFGPFVHGQSAPVFAQALCDPASATEGQRILSGLRIPGAPFDSIEARIGWRTVGRIGWRCDNAPNRESCERAFAVTEPPSRESPWRLAAHGQQQGPLFLIVERAGSFRVLAAEAEVHSFLGPIDTLEEAALVAWMRGYAPWCGEDTSTGQADNEGWVLTARSSTFPDAPRWEPSGSHEYVHEVRVERDGAFTFRPLGYFSGLH